MLTDDIIKLLAIGGLLIHAAAAGLLLTGRLGHWPLTIALLVITIGVMVVMYLDGLPWNEMDFIVLTFCLGTLGAAVWQVAAASKWSMAAVVLAGCLQGMLLLGIVLFLQFFRMDRLW